MSACAAIVNKYQPASSNLTATSSETNLSLWYLCWMGGEEREDVMDVGRKGEREKRERRKREKRKRKRRKRERGGRGHKWDKWERMAGSKSMHTQMYTWAPTWSNGFDLAWFSSRANQHFSQTHFHQLIQLAVCTEREREMGVEEWDNC